MPLPIWPAPMMPMVLMVSVRSDVMLCSGLMIAPSRALALGELGVELGHDLEEVSDDAVIGDLEDRGLFVLVEGDDHLAVVHAVDMLNGAVDADGDIELGRHDLAGLPNLVVVGDEAGIDGGARGTHRGAELVGHAFEDLEIVARLHAAAARDDDARARQLWPLRFRELGADIARETARSRAGNGLDRGTAAFARGGGKA